MPAGAHMWPATPLTDAAWPTSSNDGFTFHVQPPLNDPVSISANAFQIEYGPVFASALEVSSAILATERADQIDVYAYVEPVHFERATRLVDPTRTPHRSVVLDPDRDAILVNVTELVTLSGIQVEDAVRNAVTQVGARQISQNAVPPAFSTGIALYVELPTSEYAARLASIVQQADKDSALLTWFDLNRPPSGTDPESSWRSPIPSLHSLSIVLIFRHCVHSWPH